MNRSIPESHICHIVSFTDPVPYPDALTTQVRLASRRQEGEIPDTLLLLEHPPTITLGRRTNDADMLTDAATLLSHGIRVERTDRGGEITYHGPGQLVGYPILDLRAHGQDLHRYLRDLEEVLIRALAPFGLHGERVGGLTGVWVDGAKIAAIGIKVSRWVSMHGFALNINPDLAPMRRDFVPCGIKDRGVTSLAERLPGENITRAQIEPQIVAAFAEVFGVTPRFQALLGIMAA